MTDRLYYRDSYLWDFTASVRHCSDDGLRLTLDRTAFYPSSGGQPHDLGTLGDHQVLDVVEEADDIVHVLNAPWPAGLDHARGLIDPVRRLDHMQQHTGQHLLSAVMAEEFALTTVSFHLGAESSTVDVEPATVSPSKLLEIERRVNERLRENRATTVSFEDAALTHGLRKESGRQGILRIVSIDGLDRSACGGTHVRQTGEIGMILLGGTEKVRQALRIEFFCGARVLPLVRHLSDSAVDLRGRLAESDKVRKKLSLDLAELAGQRRFEQSQPNELGRFLWVEDFLEIDEALRISATAFASNSGAMVALTGRQAGTLLFASHPRLGVDCGKRLKPLLDAAGGRGGGSTKMAQGSVPDASLLPAILEKLLL